MANNSGIEWTDATWNPIAGCTPISPGCTHCYAATMARRLEAMGQEKYCGTAERRGSVDVFTGLINLDESALEIPLHWKKPRRIFVNSMSDLFHEDVPDDFIGNVFSVMADCPRHTFQILTKRAERMGQWIRRYRERPLPQIWLGVSVEDQQRANERIPLLLETPATLRFLSCEPLLGPITLDAEWLYERCPGCGRHGDYCDCDLPDEYADTALVNWVIVGGESGHGARTSHPDWFRSLRDQCQAAGVPFFFKQWGEWAPGDCVPGGDLGRDFRRGIACIVRRDGKPDGHFHKGDAIVRRIGKKAAGRILDGREWNEFPKVESALAT